MSNGTLEQEPVRTNGAIKPSAKSETVISYIPLGEKEEIHLTLSRTRQFLCIPTRSGKWPTDEQIVKYMMLCKAGGLNPWVNDAYLVGYDSNDGPSFSLITSVQAFLKRAEASPEYDGIEQGVIVLRENTLTERKGDLLLAGETLIGGWARVHRKDRSIPSFDALNLNVFNTGKSRWAKDPAGMIVKCAMASALRTAFPSTLAAMQCQEEMDMRRAAFEVAPAAPESKANRLASRLVPAITSNSATAGQAIEYPTITDEPVGVVREEIPGQTEKTDPLKSVRERILACETEEDIAAISEQLSADPTLKPEQFNEINAICEGRIELLKRKKK